MTRSEAKRRLIEAFPKRTIAIHLHDWHFPDHKIQPKDQYEYRVSILPGLDGADCQSFTGQHLAELVEKIIADAFPESPAELDLQFA